jgi:GTP-binding protein
MTLTLAIIGRPNVGKSTLFNRMVRKKLAIVHDQPGVTRDWKMAPADIYGRPVLFVDTAGLEEAQDKGSIEAKMRTSTEQAIDLADILLFMVDGRTGVTPQDEFFADIARRSNKEILLIVNKCEGQRGRDGLSDAYGLGLGDPFLISAEHGDGFSDLFDTLHERAMAYEAQHKQEQELQDQESDEEPESEQARDAQPEVLDALEGEEEFEFADDHDPDLDIERPLKVAIVGRPNAGKSTLMNTLLGEERVLTGPQAGLTRDSIAVDWEYEGRKFKLVDTAGLRRKSKIDAALERQSADESLRNIRLAQIVVLVVDATLSLDKQDLLIASHVLNEGRALVLAMNKWDIVEDKDRVRKEFSDRLERSLAQLPDIPFISMSALNGRNINKVMGAVLDVYQNWNKRLSTGQMNRWLGAMESRHPAPLTQNRPNRLRYITQIKTRPPTFALWVSRPDDLPDSYKRYLIRGIREDFGIEKVPIRLVLRTSKNPYVN